MKMFVKCNDVKRKGLYVCILVIYYLCPLSCPFASGFRSGEAGCAAND